MMLKKDGDGARMSLWRWVGVCVLALSFVFTGCMTWFLRDTPTPIPTRAERVSEAEATADTLVVFMPGRGGSMNDFEQQGFIEIMRGAGLRADTVAVDAHLGYYFNRSVTQRLQADVILPARAKGYRRIVLVGVSLGGVGALLHERDYPGFVDGIVLLAPYLGREGKLFGQIRAAGGPVAWAAGRDLKAGEVEEQLWSFLGQRVQTLPATWLFYGRSDDLAPGHQLFATLLPPSRAKSAEGDHDWPTWRTLWTAACRDGELFKAKLIEPGKNG
jgi:pimeloyl-ACP methyl ester carboxylesterase